MKTRFKILAAVLPALVLMGCSKGDPEGEFRVKNGDNSNRQASTFVYSEAKVSLSDIDIDFEPESGQDQEMEFEGNYTFDLLSSDGTNEVELAAGTYTELEFDMSANLNGGSSMIVRGTAESNGNSYDFEFATSMEGEFEIESEDGETAEEGSNVDFILLMDLDGMFAGVDFANAVIDSDNVIRINENSNEAIRALIEANIASNMSFDSE